MKKILYLILALLIALSAPLTALASDTSVEYTDEKTGASFIIPGGWKEIHPENIGCKADFCFLHQKSEAEIEEAEADEAENEDGDFDKKEEELVVPYITYSSFDYYALDPNGKKSREELNIENVSTKALAAYLGIKETKLSKATYNRVDYYRFTTKAKKVSSTLDPEQRVTGYVTVKDGWLYQLMFFDSTTSPWYDDFKSVMNSFKIVGAVPETKVKKKSAASKVIGVIIVICAIGAFIIVLIKTKKK